MHTTTILTPASPIPSSHHIMLEGRKKKKEKKEKNKEKQSGQ